MSESGFGKNDKQAKHVFVLDDRLETVDIQFVVFILEDQVKKITLSSHRPSLSFQEKTFSVIDEQLWVSGQQLKTGLNVVDGSSLLVVSAKKAKTTAFVFKDKDYFEISANPTAEVRTTEKNEIVLHNGTALFNQLGQFTYYNGEKVVKANTVEVLAVGSTILTRDFLLEKRANQWRITDFNNQIFFSPGASLLQKVKQEFPIQFPKYRRSPRVYQEPTAEKIKLEKIQESSKEDKNNVLKMIAPPIGMLVVTGLTSVFSGRNPLMMLGMGFMSVLTTIFTVSQYFHDKKERLNQEQKTEDDYDQYLTDTVAKIARKYDKETTILNYKNPSPQELIDMIARFDSRIYERMNNNKDFLEVSLGKGSVQSVLTIDSNINDKDTDINTQQIRKIKQRFELQRQVPITLNLTRQVLGMVGTYSVLKVAVLNLLIQLSFFHSYRDVQFLAVVPEDKYQNDWRLLRFLRHFELIELGFKGLVHNEQSRDIVLNQFYQLLNKRRQLLDEAGKDKPQFSPQYVLTIMDDSLIAGHAINEFLAEDMSDLGVSVIWTKEDQKFLPETVTALVEYKNQGAGELINDQDQYVAKSFDPYHEPKKIEANLRKLANLEHVEVEKNRIPDNLSLLEQYEVEKVTDLELAKRWESADPSKSIKSLIGWRGQKEQLFWDLHERVHGPHALVGGTTGSGKSEFLTTYLIGLAINFSPEDVGMLIIDWKGGGIANTLAPLPHFMGSITNLDGAGTARALDSIKAELDKRMTEFAKYGVNNINGYMRLYKERLTPKADVKYPDKPIPHLILVSDEFAELKANVPEFLDELTSVARIGRSLGVHLILATQKPSGVVNDQIEANSTSKIALKMASEQDSNELLKTHDAAHITQPGRGYLKVGQNEVYELFQSGYAGVSYNPGVTKKEVIDERIYHISDLGQSELVYDPGEEVNQGIDTSDLPTQLEAVIDEVNRVYEKKHTPLPERPWLPNLGEEILTPVVSKKKNKRNMAVPFGLLDIPSQQSQKVDLFDIQEAGNTAIFSSPGFGKSTTLQTIVMNLSRQNTPEQVQFNLLDFGTNGLLPLNQLPHTIDMVALDEKEKLRKMIDRIEDEVKQRKQLFKKHAVANLSQFEEKTTQVLPILVNVLDSYDGLDVQDRRKERIDSVLIQILREGPALGVYLLMSAGRVGAVRMNMMAKIQSKIALYLNDESEITNLMGRERLQQVALPGRGQVIDEVPTAIQVYLPNQVKSSDNNLDDLQVEIDELNKDWLGDRPEKIPMVPDELKQSDFETLPQIQEWLSAENLPLGLSYETTDIRGLISHDQPYFLFAPIDDEQNAAYQAQLFDQLKQVDKDVLLVDFNESFDETLSSHSLSDNMSLVSDSEDIGAVIKGLAAYTKLAKNHEQGKPTILVISDLSDFLKKTNTKLTTENLVNALKASVKSGLDIIIFSQHDYFAKSYEEGPKALRQMKFSGLIGARVYDSALMQGNGVSTEPMLNSWEAYYVMKGGAVYDKIKLPQDLLGEM